MIRFLRSVLIGYVLIIVVLSFLQRKLLFPATRSDAMPVAQADWVAGVFPAAEDVAIQTEDGLTIRGWLLRKTSNNDRPLVVYYHGNGGDRSMRGHWYNLLNQYGADVLAIDYHGYGDSDGAPTEGTLEMDCRATLAYVTDCLLYTSPSPRDS